MQSNDTKNANNQLLYFFVTSVWVMIWNNYYIYVLLYLIYFYSWFCQKNIWQVVLFLSYCWQTNKPTKRTNKPDQILTSFDGVIKAKLLLLNLNNSKLPKVPVSEKVKIHFLLSTQVTWEQPPFWTTTTSWRSAALPSMVPLNSGPLKGTAILDTVSSLINKNVWSGVKG